jgi:iron complex outermembrane receptor protein
MSWRFHIVDVFTPSAFAGNARAALLAGLSMVSTAAFAQNRTDDNAITQAEDAFGFSVGRESIGIYNATQARGFSPTQAGNVRIDGLYFDPAFGLQDLLINNVSIKVGLSAQGYPFAAPSGIVDQSLRRPSSRIGGSLVVSGDDWGGYSAQLDGSIPIADRLAVRAGFNGGAQEFRNGTNNRNYTVSLLARWRPADNVEIVPFWAEYNDFDDEVGTFYIPAGSFIAITDRVRHDPGPLWADHRFSGRNVGVLSSVALGENWIVRLGAFRSDLFDKHNYSFFLANQQPDGTGERILIADPPAHNRSLSGELRVTHSISEGPRLHVVHASIRMRDASSEFGGSDTVSFGVGPVGERITDPKPDFVFGEQTRRRVQQVTYGLAYDGRWRDVGEISFGLSRASYRKVTRIPLLAPVEARASPWLYNATAALIVSHAVSLYAGYARGFEESGIAPLNAANRNEPLESILTEQKDAGVRIRIAGDIAAVAGLFDLSRPYFGFDSANDFRRIGSVRSRGAEFSISGRPTPKLSLVLGGVLLRSRVAVGPDVQGQIGSKPFGLPSHIVNFNANWQTPLRGLQLDVQISHRGRQPATTDNSIVLPPRLNVNLGGRYAFRLAGQSASLRLQVQDALDNHDPVTPGPGIYLPGATHQVLGFLTVDF